MKNVGGIKNSKWKDLPQEEREVWNSKAENLKHVGKEEAAVGVEKGEEGMGEEGGVVSPGESS